MRLGGLAMGLTNLKIGTFVELYSEQCNNSRLTIYDISGVNREKEFFEPSKQAGSDTSKYKIVPPNYFACNLMHVGRDKVLPIAMNHTGKNKVVSPAYTVFKIKNDVPILKEYFFMMLKSEERDRYFWFQTDSSIREGMSWEDFCELEIYIPSLSIQQKYVNIYNAMLENQNSYERGLEDLKIVCDGFIEDLRKKIPCEKIGKYLVASEERNKDRLGLDSVRGIATSKEMISTKADMKGVSLANYKTVAPKSIAYVPDTSRRGDKISLGFNNTNDTVLVSSISIVFGTNHEKLLPDYLMLFFTRSEFDRFARYNSWGSARETFKWEDMCDVEIPIPEVKTQLAIADIFSVYNIRKEINEKLKAQIKSICPILIKGSLEDSRHG